MPVRAVAVISETVGGRVGVKASGGIRTAAVAILDAGATRVAIHRRPSRCGLGQRPGIDYNK